MSSTAFGHGPDRIRLGDLDVCRMGFGAMRLPGPNVWGPPADADEARRVLRRAVDLGVELIDTSWYYGPFVANELIAEALYPYPSQLVLACKLGGKRLPDASWAPFNRPEELRIGCEHDLRTLRLERLDVVHLRWMDTGVPFTEQLDALIALQAEGKIRHIALSTVSAPMVEAALARTPIVAVQNLYNVTGGDGKLARMTHALVESPDAVLDLCEARGIAYLPFFPLAVGQVGAERPALLEIAARHGRTVFQVAIAWLLARSKVMLPIPGTGRVAHLEDNWAARTLQLTPDEVAAIGAG